MRVQKLSILLMEEHFFSCENRRVSVTEKFLKVQINIFSKNALLIFHALRSVMVEILLDLVFSLLKARFNSVVGSAFDPWIAA